MNLTQVKTALALMDAVRFLLPDGQLVPEHFHITEVGQISKKFIDCGGTLRDEQVINFQLWEAGDFDHRLAPGKLAHIIELSEKALQLNPELEIEVEYQGNTIGKYGLDVRGTDFVLTSKFTNCLASDKCGIPEEKLKVNLADAGKAAACCTPGGGCC